MNDASPSPREKDVAQIRLLKVFSGIRMRLSHLATRLLGQEEAEDALQEAFMKLWQKPYPEASEQELEKICTGTVYHVSIDALRQRQRVQPLGEEQETAAEETTPSCEERFAAVERLMRSALTPQQYDMMYRRECLEQEYDTIAQVWHTTPTAVRMQLSRARRKIHDLYLQQYDADDLP